MKIQIFADGIQKYNEDLSPESFKKIQRLIELLPLNVDVNKIIAKVAKHFLISREQLLTDSNRNRELVKCRAIIITYLMEECRWNCTDAGRVFDLNHATALHNKKICKAQFMEDYEKIFKGKTKKESRCCGRCDGVNDICVTDTTCEKHSIMGCEICYGER